jgi:glycolate oxidase iron-sulfur subunit
MQTNFTKDQLLDPDTRLAESILRKCVHCGFCLATCPTYVLDGDERDSPRGRIYLMKEYFETGEGATDVQIHLDRCLTCGSCETTCPSGVDYLQLVDLGRTRLGKESVRGEWSRFVRRALITVMTNRKIFRLGLALGRSTRPLHGLLPQSLKSMASLLPSADGGVRDVPQLSRPEGARKMRVALHLGCVQRDLRPEINAATIRVLTKLGCEVIVPPGFECCGALADHLGEKGKAKTEAGRNIKAILEAGGEEGFDAIVSNASGCGIALKDYGYLFRGDDQMRESAQMIADMTLDVSQVLASLDLGPVRGGNGTRVAYQASCTLQHGQKITGVPKDLLRHFGYEVVEPKDPHLCCGFAGTYSILEPKRSARLQARKSDNLAALGADVVASGNIGCITGLGNAMDLPVKHMIELIDEALE